MSVEEKVSERISESERSPESSQAPSESNAPGDAAAPNDSGRSRFWLLLRRFWRQQMLAALANLKLAIVLFLAIAAFSILGTVIEQGETLAFYQQNYPEDPALFGFLNWKVILALGLDRVYHTRWFLSLLVLFGSSLTACTFTRQLPALKAARRWSFYTRPQQFAKLALSAEIANFSTDAQPASDKIASLLQEKNYRVFREGEGDRNGTSGEGEKIYARKGIAGRIGPIVVHASMLIILAGAIVGNTAGVVAQQMIPSGETQAIDNFTDVGPRSQPQKLQQWLLHVNRFWIDYTLNGAIDQFYTDLSVVDADGNERLRKTISVNDPLRYQGFTVYQTDWGIAAVRVRVGKSPAFQIPLISLDTGGRGRLWGTWIPTQPDLSEGAALLAADLQGTLLAYDATGEAIGAVRVGGSLLANGKTLYVDDLLGSTGLQIKADPGIPLVYLGFGLLMLSVAASYVSHAQFWVLVRGDRLYLGARTNRAQVALEREFLDVLERSQSPEKT